MTPRIAGRNRTRALSASPPGRGGGAPPGQLTAQFLSQWTNSTGQLQAAITDGGIWTGFTGDYGATCNGNVIVNPGTIGFPDDMEHVFRVRALGARDGLVIPRKTGLVVPSNGQTINYRWYFNCTLPDDLTDFEMHPVQDGNAAGDSNWMFKVLTPGSLDGQWQIRFHTQAGANYRWDGPVFSKGVGSRIEAQVVRLTDTTFNLHVATYDANGSQDSDDADYEDTDSGLFLSGNPTLTFVNPANLDGLNCGSNGITSPPAAPFDQSYQGGFAVINNRPVGSLNHPYGTFVGEPV